MEKSDMPELNFQDVPKKEKDSFGLKSFSDEDVKNALLGVEINPIDISILRPFEGLGNRVMESIKAVIEETNCTKLTDLGCNKSIEIVSKKIVDLGFEQYVGIDLAIKSKEYETDERLKVKLINGEILTVLRGMDNTTSHFCMSGIELGTVVSGDVLSWGKIVLSEIRRNMPEKGILYTDVGSGFLHHILENEHEGFDDKILFLKSFIWGRTSADNMKRRFPNYSIEDFIPNEDIGFLGDFYFDLPELGFRLFLSKDYIIKQQSYIPVILQKIDF